MKVYTNEKGEIKAVGFSTDEALVEITLDDEDNPFKGWSEAKICCYKITAEDGHVTMMTPYVDSRLIEHIGRLGAENAALSANLDYVAMMTDIEL